MTTPPSIEFTVEIVTAFLSSNAVPVGEVGSLIASVNAALNAAAGAPQTSVTAEAPIPAVSIRKSVTPEYLICLDDGKRFKSLRRHLTLLGMTPEQYRAKWGLPGDYPMVAARYAATRSEMAKSLARGRKHEDPAAARVQTAPARKVGRPRKASA